MIERLSGFPGHVLGFVCGGRVRKTEYETVVLLAVESALRQHEKVRLYYEIALDFSHVEPGVSHNFNLGMGAPFALGPDCDRYQHRLGPGDDPRFQLLDAGSRRDLFTG